MLRHSGQLRTRILRLFPGMRPHRCPWSIICSQCVRRQFSNQPLWFYQCVPHLRTFPRVYAPKTSPRFPTGSSRRASFGTRTPPQGSDLSLIMPPWHTAALMLHRACPTPIFSNSHTPTPSKDIPTGISVIHGVLMSPKGTTVCHAHHIYVK
jgi:hypothetical protein